MLLSKKLLGFSRNCQCVSNWWLSQWESCWWLKRIWLKIFLWFISNYNFQFFATIKVTVITFSELFFKKLLRQITTRTFILIETFLIRNFLGYLCSCVTGHLRSHCSNITVVNQWSAFLRRHTSRDDADYIYVMCCESFSLLEIRTRGCQSIVKWFWTDLMSCEEKSLFLSLKLFMLDSKSIVKQHNTNSWTIFVSKRKIFVCILIVWDLKLKETFRHSKSEFSFLSTKFLLAHFSLCMIFEIQF